MVRVLRLVFGLGISGALLLAILLGIGFFVFLGSLERAEGRDFAPVDGIVALTGGSERISDAIDLLARGRGQRLLITGVNEKTTREELARQKPEFRSYFACCVDLDYEALNTIGNARQTRNWVQQHGFGSLLVVTSTYHMPRTLAELQASLPGVRLVPHPVVPERLDIDGWWRDPALARLLAMEYAKYVVAVARIHLGAQPTAGSMARGSSLPGGALLRKS
ncbi:YdcF family protein [Alsobacter sp. SYSU M60028]|uniref:YdcF family protein n=1 Tax=Alsobacter ponti TaxID=2962936 RepID=A0ABT1LB48_9HYPH|nr:YdcF family protein [Alsobacter ponti]MCP8938707.1 YdcF family protein [Alsobacter ponti]